MCFRDIQLDDALLEKQREAYAVKGVDESEPAQPQKKRKQAYVNGEDVSASFTRHPTIANRYSGIPSPQLTLPTRRPVVASTRPRKPDPPPSLVSARTQPST